MTAINFRGDYTGTTSDGKIKQSPYENEGL